ANVASGVRMANLAELSSDGLHEGVFTYEIGDPGLKNEQLLAADLQLRYAAGALQLSVSPFYRYFLDYIYLSPTEEEWFGFPVYRFRQQDARQYGAEAEATVDLL
ncbi:MAG: TonB-dependent receptor, partial [Saprospiraceae bacterium]|nr:TonB-dependent receptor [Saprospiraceae bacterium]